MEIQKIVVFHILQSCSPLSNILQFKQIPEEYKFCENYWMKTYKNNYKERQLIYTIN